MFMLISLLFGIMRLNYILRTILILMIQSLLLLVLELGILINIHRAFLMMKIFLKEILSFVLYLILVLRVLQEKTFERIGDSTRSLPCHARVIAVTVLARRGAEADLALLGRLAAGDPDLELRQEAVRALGESGLAAAAPALGRLLPPEESDLRRLPEEARLIALDAIHALGLLRAREAVPALLALFEREWELAVTPGATLVGVS